MTVLQPASWHDVVFVEDFLEGALDDFDRICEGVPVSVVDVVFFRWQGCATAGRLDPDWPADVLVSVLLGGADARPVRLYRWIERELLCMCEAAIARCVRPVTPPLEVSCITQLVTFVWIGCCRMWSSFVCLMCRGGCRFFVRMSLVLS